MFSAIKENLERVFNELYSKLNRGDHLFFFGMDHGVANKDTSFLCLWGPGEPWRSDDIGDNVKHINRKYLYSDQELKDHLAPLKNKGVICAGVFGQCYSGGFVTKLNEIGVPAASSCTIEEYAKFSSNKEYSEFLYHWINAINECGPDGRGNKTDINEDGIVSLKEAFNYAKSNDEFSGHIGSEHPQYASSPEFLGEHLAFNYIPPTKDIFIKDFVNDNGNDSLKFSKAWQSPYIFCNNLEANTESHTDLCVYAPNQDMFVHVTVHNRGIEQYPAGLPLKVYWTSAMLGLGSNSFNQSNSYDGGSETQGIIGSTALPEIAVGDSITIVFPWRSPKLDSEENQHIGFYAILGGGTPNPDLHAVSTSNKSALRISCVIPKDRVSKWSRVFIHNPSDETNSYTITFPKSDKEEVSLYSVGNVELLLDNPLYNAWSAGGKKGIYEVNPSNPRSVLLTSESSRLANILLEGGKTCELRLKSHFIQVPMSKSWIRAHDLCVMDNAENLIGGCSFKIYSPTNISVVDPIIVHDSIVSENSGTITLSIGNGDYSSALWTDSEGKILGTSDMITVKQKPGTETYRLMAINDEGEWGQNDITLPSTTGIETIGLQNNRIKVTLKKSIVTGDVVRIVSASDGKLLNDIMLESDKRVIDFEIPATVHGVCSVTYFRGDILWDDARIIIK